MPLGSDLKTQIADYLDIRYDHFSPVSGDPLINRALAAHARARGLANHNDYLRTRSSPRASLAPACSTSTAEA